jgi:hypothetical protein
MSLQNPELNFATKSVSLFQVKHLCAVYRHGSSPYPLLQRARLLDAAARPWYGKSPPVPSVCSSAFLQSSIPAPVDFLNSDICAAVTAIYPPILSAGIHTYSPVLLPLLLQAYSSVPRYQFAELSCLNPFEHSICHFCGKETNGAIASRSNDIIDRVSRNWYLRRQRLEYRVYWLPDGNLCFSVDDEHDAGEFVHRFDSAQSFCVLLARVNCSAFWYRHEVSSSNMASIF